jgi:hypothetical protein
MHANDEDRVWTQDQARLMRFESKKWNGQFQVWEATTRASMAGG